MSNRRSECSRARLLIVDDEPINALALYQALCADHQVLMATGGIEALALCRAQLPDLVLLDIHMPDLTGYDVCLQMKADAATRDIPVIFVTARSAPEDESHVFSIGAVDFISKPINPDVVRARVRTHLMLKHQSDLLREMAFVDGLTGLFNRRYFDMRSQQEWSRAVRTGSSLALLMADVDCFKAYNDRYGHQAGDDCLRQVSQRMKGSLARPSDALTRFGGEEFAGILPDTDLQGARCVATRLEKAVRALDIAHADSSCGGIVTVSVGAASAVPAERGELHSLLAQADQALYRAKAAGRGRAAI